MKPLCIELFAGTFGWSQGWHELGGYTVGFDIEHQPYHGSVPKGDDLVLQDVLTLHGRQFKDASIILASSPCQAYSYMAMPWGRSKQIARALRGEDVFPDGYEGYRTIAELNALFEAPRRIQREASEAAGRHIPMIRENVRGAIPWVGRSQWNFGSFHLWGDVPALMPPTLGKKVMKEGVTHRNGETNFHASAARAATGVGMKGTGGSWFGVSPTGARQVANNPARGVAIGEGLRPGEAIARFASSKSVARKAASAKIARIPTELARHIAQVYYPLSAGRSAQPHD